MFTYITDTLKKLLTLGQLLRIAISTILLISFWGWRADGTRPIQSMAATLQFLGVATTPIDQVQTYLQGPGRAPAAAMAGAVLIFLGAVGAAAKPLADFESNAFPATWLGVLACWQTMSSLGDLGSPLTLAATGLTAAVGLGLLWKYADRATRPDLGRLLFALVANGAYVILVIVSVTTTRWPSRPKQGASASA